MTEHWKDVVGYEGIYQVSSNGRIKSLARFIVCGHGGRMKRETILKNQTHPDGYPQIELNLNAKKFQVKIHRLVAQSFLSNPLNLPYVNHKDGDKTNNSIENLEWCTPSENLIHAYSTGLKTCKNGNEHHNTKINSDEHKKVLGLLKNNSQRKVAKIYGVSQTVIQNILRKSI